MSRRHILVVVAANLLVTHSVPWNAGAAAPPSRTGLYGDSLPPGAIARLGSVPWRTHKEIKQIAFVPGGKYLVSRSNYHTTKERSLSVWDLQTGRGVRTISSDGTSQSDGFEDGFSFSPDGKFLLSADEPGKRMRPNFQNHPISSRLYLWDFYSGKLLKRSPDLGEVPYRLAIRLDGQMAAYGTLFGNVGLWDLQKNSVRRVVMSDRYKILGSLNFAGGGKDLVVLPSDGGVSLRIDIASGKVLKMVELGECPCNALSPHDGTIATLSGANQLTLYDTLTGEKRRVPLKDKVGSSELTFSPDGRTLLTMDHDAEVVAFLDVVKGRLLRRLHVAGLASTDMKPKLLLSANGEWLGSYELYHEDQFSETVVRIWDARTGQPQSRLSRHISPPVQLAFSADGKEIISYAHRENSRGGQWCRWEIATGKLLTCTLPASPRREEDGASHDLKLVPGFQDFAGRLSSAMRVAESPDGRLMSRFDEDSRLHLYEVSTGKIVHLFTDDYTAIAFSPYGWQLATGCKSDASVLIWDLPVLFRSQPLRGKDTSAEALWDVLASGDAVQAQRALWRLAALPETDVFLTRHLNPVEAVPPARLNVLLTDLGSPEFATRGKAEQTLAAAGEPARVAVAAALAEVKDLEVRLRLQRIQERLHPQAPERLREVRAVMLLESRGTPEARRLLQKLATGQSESRLTKEAKASLKRLSR